MKTKKWSKRPNKQQQMGRLVVEREESVKSSNKYQKQQLEKMNKSWYFE